MSKDIAVINPSVAKKVLNKELNLADTKMPMLAIAYKDVGTDPENPNEYCAIEIDANGSDDSKFILYLNIGASSTDYTQYQFSAYATGVADPSAVDSSPTHTQCTTLKALIVAMRASDDGLTVYRLNAPADYSIDTDDFIDLAETEFGGPALTEVMYRDASEILVLQARIGVPQVMDKGLIELLGIRAFINSNSATDCELKISYDPDDIDESKEVDLGYSRAVPDAAWTDLLPEAYNSEPPVLQGPILVEFTSAVAMTETTARALVRYRSANY
jgi:hypothetical protein